TPAAPAASRFPNLLPDAVLLLVLSFLYSHAFTSDYAMKDEMALVGWAPRWPVQSPLAWGAEIWRLSGRWLGGFLWNLPFVFAADDPARLRLVRFALVVILAITAVVTRRLLDRTLHAPAATTLLVLAIFAQVPFWSYAGYGAGTFRNVSSLLLALVVALSQTPVLPRPEGEVVIDWNEFVRAQARRKGIDWRSLQRVGGDAAGRAPRPGPPAS
ncbi:hypothetical protein KGQ64_10180, partial [bacterium]|nr:hypothetical protein [bacterium]